MKYTDSIKSNTEFKRMYYKSKYKIGFLTVIYLKKNREKTASLGITVSKKVGNAVVRNRVRRIILSAYQELEKTEDYRGLTIVVVARKSCCKVKMWDILKEMKRNLDILKGVKTKNILKKVKPTNKIPSS